MKGDPQTDPKGLIQESYRIEGITPVECRSIFVDWALSLPDGQDSVAVLVLLLERYAAEAPDHPMTAILREGQQGASAPKRRGGARGRQG